MSHVGSDSLSPWAGAQWWMVSNVATGAATASFLNLLVPPFITSVTASAARVGVVFAMVSLAAAVGPWVGRAAARTGRYRQLYLSALVAMVAAFALLAIGASSWRWTPLFGLLLGAAYATQGTLGPAFIVGSDDDEDLVAARLTAFMLAYPIGQLLGAVVVAIGLGAGAGTASMFWIAAGSLAVLTASTWSATAAPARRLSAAAEAARTAESTDDEADADQAGSSARFAAIALSAFGAFLLAVSLSSLGSNGLTSQIANVMPEVYGVSAVQTSLLLGAAGLINVAAIVWAGRQLVDRGALSLIRVGTIVRAGGALAMAILGMSGNVTILVPAIAMLVTFQGIPIPRIAAPPLAAALAPIPATEANGFYFASSALGAVVGCLLGGFLAEHVGYNAVNWMAAAGSGVALVALARIRSASVSRS